MFTQVKHFFILLLAFAITVFVSPAAASAEELEDTKPTKLTVMTWNLYLGADLGDTFTAATPEALVLATTQAFATVQATNFPERAKVIADEIAKTDPHVIGIQEVILWRSQFPADFNPTPNAPDIEYDFLAILLDELEARGKNYQAVTTVINADAEAPRITPEGLQDIRITDRDVLLVRGDLKSHEFSAANAQSDNFDTFLSFPNPVSGSISIPRGWNSVDTTIDGHTVRVVNTHLERFHPLIQVAQANELLAGPLNTSLPVILMGDLNSAAGGIGAIPGESDTPTYNNLLAAGFADTWTKQTGFTCCNAENLLNESLTYTERIDYILTRGNLETSAVKILGDKLKDRTPSGLWPADHAGVWAMLHVK